MYADDDSKFTNSMGDAKVTVFPKYNMVALGYYHNPTGGMDGIKDTQAIKDSLYLAADLAEGYGYDIVMEGILASTVKSTYLALFQEADIQRRFEPIVVFFTTPVDVCLKRIYERNGGKAIRENLVQNKYDTIMRQPQYFSENGIQTVCIDNTNCSRDNMLPAFLRAVERWRERIGD
jgi:hypothetical protein